MYVHHLLQRCLLFAIHVFFSTTSRGEMEETVIIRSHGGRARAIEEGSIAIDVAFLAAPACDALGNSAGCSGKSEIKLTLRATGRVVEDLRGRISAGRAGVETFNGGDCFLGAGLRNMKCSSLRPVAFSTT